MMRARAALLGLLLLSGCGGASAPAVPRLVVLYATCTLQKAQLSPYEPAASWTPNLAEFARRGVVFERHQTESGISGVAFASILSGRQATGHGVFSHPRQLPGEITLIGESFRDAGWEVYHWADHAMASPQRGYSQGVPPGHVLARAHPFEVPDPRRAPEDEAFLRADDPRFVALLDRLAEDPQARALLVTTFTVTHAPYSSVWLDEFCAASPTACELPEAPAFERLADLFWSEYVDLSWRYDATVARLGLGADDRVRLDRTAARLYAANVHRLDRLFGDLLRAIAEHGLEDESLVAFTADHGEVLERPTAALRWNHGFTLAPEVLSVPWILAGPGIAPSRRSGVTRSVDVFPTLAGLAGVPITDPGVEGRNLAPALLGRQPFPKLSAFSHTALVPQALLDASRSRGGTRLDALHPDRDPLGMWVSMRDGDMVFKWTRPVRGTFRPSAFDHARDPRETLDVYDAGDPRHREAMERLRAYKQRLVDAFRARPADAGVIDPARRRQLLRSLGYIE
jgi:arylsulfatase A-like enzyme